MLRPTTLEGRRGLAAILAEPRRSLVALDYDGTLAPIVPRPEDAVPQPGAVEALTQLTARVGRIALVTGRPADLVVALGGLDRVPGLVVLGQYGVQRWQAGSCEQEPPLPGLALAREALGVLVVGYGLDVEDKGHSLVVHARQAADPVGALAPLLGPLAQLAVDAGLELHTGRLVLELRPPGHDKGSALLTLMDDVSGVLYVGDDRGDLAAFDAVDRLRDQGIEGLLVCSDSDECPDELRNRADLIVAGPPGVVRLLEDLARAL